MIDAPRLVAIVEGKGEVEAVPGLLRRVLQERLSRYDIVVPKAKFAGGRPQLEQKLEDFVEYALIEQSNAIIVILDADEDCPRIVATQLAARARDMGLQVPVAIVCPKPEYEIWFIAGLSSDCGDEIRNRLQIAQSVNAPTNMESRRSAKDWLKRMMPKGRNYKPTQDQAALTYHIPMDVVFERSRSFRRLCDAVEELVAALDEGGSMVTPLEE